MVRATLMWMIHDFPAFAMMVGTTNKGYFGCPVCGPHTEAIYSNSLTKLVYVGHHRRWLPFGHPFRRDTVIFPSVEEQGPPPRMAGVDHSRWAYLRSKYMRMGGVEGGDADPMYVSRLKRLPTTHSLPYWIVRTSLAT